MRASDAVATSAVLDGLARVIAHVCAISPAHVQPDAYLLAYDVDSLRAVDLFLGIEEEFGVVVPEHDPRQQRIRTVRDLATYVVQLQQDDRR